MSEVYFVGNMCGDVIYTTLNEEHAIRVAKHRNKMVADLHRQKARERGYTQNISNRDEYFNVGVLDTNEEDCAYWWHDKKEEFFSFDKDEE